MSRLASLTPPQGWSAALVDHLGIEPWRIPVVVIAAIAVYVSLVLLLRVFGARLLSGLSTFDTVVAIMIGSMGARVIFGAPAHAGRRAHRHPHARAPRGGVRRRGLHGAGPAGWSRRRA